MIDVKFEWTFPDSVIFLPHSYLVIVVWLFCCLNLGNISRMEDYIARRDFTRCVEQDMTNGIIAEAFEMDQDDLKRRRAQSVRNVKTTNGLISLEKYARSRQEQDWDDDEWQD